jgi:serine/threonine protein phosphatase PrpC
MTGPVRQWGSSGANTRRTYWKDGFKMPRSYAPRRLECSGFSCVGAVREKNADQFLIADLSSPCATLRHDEQQPEPVCSESGAHGQLLLVADGIGTGRGGMQASRIVVDVLSRYLVERDVRQETNDVTTLSDLVDQLHRCQDAMRHEAQRTAVTSMGTTVTLACVLGNTLNVLHAGDSRCYVLRGGKLHCLTTDHTLAQQLVEHRCLDSQTARHSRLQHVLWNAITADCPEFELQSVARKILPNDLLLLCSDGLTKHLSEDDIVSIATDEDSAEVITRRLVDTALAAGGTDNITVVVARYQSQQAIPVPGTNLAGSLPVANLDSV